MDESHVHYAKRKELKFKSYPCKSNYLTFWGRQTWSDREQISGWRAWGGMRHRPQRGMEEFFVLKKIVIMLIVVVVTRLSNYRPVDKKWIRPQYEEKEKEEEEQRQQKQQHETKKDSEQNETSLQVRFGVNSAWWLNQQLTCTRQASSSPQDFLLSHSKSLNLFKLSIKGISEKMQKEAKLIQGIRASLPELMTGHGGESYSLPDVSFRGRTGVASAHIGKKKK